VNKTTGSRGQLRAGQSGRMRRARAAAATPLTEMKYAAKLLNWGFAMDGKVTPVGTLARPLAASATVAPGARAPRPRPPRLASWGPASPQLAGRRPASKEPRGTGLVSTGLVSTGLVSPGLVSPGLVSPGLVSPGPPGRAT
jgi:hypothetical protein